ncbi:MAG: hypothetical protein E7105_02215 [Prevotella sp.]|nr:hypothetical protein [Prevotella sp.]
MKHHLLCHRTIGTLFLIIPLLFISPLVPSFAQVTTPLPTREGQGGGSAEESEFVPYYLSLMSPEQKVAQLTGKTLFAMADDEELGIPGWLMSDGPHGVHRQGYTSFPTGIAMAALWDRQLLLRLGHAMGEEFWAAGQHVALAPCIDLCLDPRGGRTAESAGEDPYMSGQIGKYIVRGIQSMPVMACLKHFEIEGKQAYRKTCDEIIAERDLMGFFGTNFRTALQEGVPLSLMSSYNLVNGVQAAANRHLLTDILRHRWGFPFTVISDWGGVKDGPASLVGGTDVCMGSTHYKQQLPKALEAGTITEQHLDTAVARVLLTKYAMGLMGWQPACADSAALVDNAEHRALCREATAKAVVLLRNEGRLLPLNAASSLKIAVIGPNAAAENLNCFGSSETQPAYAVSLLAGIRAVVPEATYVQGCAISGDDTSGFAAAEAAARAADVVIFAGGLDKTLEGESIIGVQVQDRTTTALPAIQQQLIRRLHAANPHLVVVLQSGGIVSLADCIADIPALVYSFYSGQEAGNGIADVLFGAVNPAGRLPMTMPVSDEQLPEWNDTYFTDDWGGGYRWFQRRGLTPQFPFGYGLSYTTFHYGPFISVERHADEDESHADLAITVSVDITNTGDCDGEEVAQLYVGPLSPADWQPLRQLRGFERVMIPAGQTRRVSFRLTPEDFYEWDVAHEAYEVPAGMVNISVGPSSADLPLSTTFEPRLFEPAPDLRVTELFTHPRHPRVGEEVTFYAYVKNQGTAPADMWALIVGTEDVPNTALGVSTSQPSTLTPQPSALAPLAPGQGTLLFCTLGSWTPTIVGDYELTARAAIIGEEELQESAPLHQRIHVYIADDPFADGIGRVNSEGANSGEMKSEGVKNEKCAGAVYDLSGRQIRHSSFDTRHSSFVTRHLPKGLYIVNGRKFVVR